MLLQVGKVLSFILSLLSLHALLVSAFFVPGSVWQERVEHTLATLALSGCICFASGILFQWSEDEDGNTSLMATLPVRIYFWACGLMAVLFVLSWYLEEYYVPLLWRNQPH